MTEPSDEMIEAAVKALAQHDGHVDAGGGLGCDCGEWREPFDIDRSDELLAAQLHHAVRAALAAALSVGEVREEWRVIYDDGRSGPTVWSNCRTEEEALRYWTEAWSEGNWPSARRQRRTIRTFPDGSVLTSPWTAVPNEEKP